MNILYRIVGAWSRIIRVWAIRAIRVKSRLSVLESFSGFGWAGIRVENPLALSGPLLCVDACPVKRGPPSDFPWEIKSYSELGQKVEFQRFSSWVILPRKAIFRGRRRSATSLSREQNLLVQSQGIFTGGSISHLEQFNTKEHKSPIYTPFLCSFVATTFLRYLSASRGDVLRWTPVEMKFPENVSHSKTQSHEGVSWFPPSQSALFFCIHPLLCLCGFVRDLSRQGHRGRL